MVKVRKPTATRVGWQIPGQEREDTAPDLRHLGPLIQVLQQQQVRCHLWYKEHLITVTDNRQPEDLGLSAWTAGRLS